MPTPLRFLALPLLLAASPVLAQTAFNGKWKADLASQTVEAKPSSYLLKDGVFRCSTCTPSYSIKANGEPQAVSGQDYWDQAAVTVVDERTVRQRFLKGGKEIAVLTSTVSPDGATLTRIGRNTNNGGNVPVENRSTTTRVGSPVTGAHLISGEWKAGGAASASDAALTMNISIKGDDLRIVYGIGETLDAKIGGAYALNQGDPGKTMTKVERVGPNALKLTDMRGGRIVQVATYTVGEDGVLRGNWSDPQSGAKGTVIARRQ